MRGLNTVDTMLQLPDEILLKILSFVPKRNEIVLVCKKFYELVCEIDRHKLKINAGNHYGEEVRVHLLQLTLNTFNCIVIVYFL